MNGKIFQNDPFVRIESYWKCRDRWFVRLMDGRSTRRSRYIMEKFLCCTKNGLPKRLEVHHIDENKCNDEFFNLQLTTKPLHRKFHYRPSMYGLSFKEYPKLYMKVYNEANMEILGKKRREYYLKNKEEILLKSSKRYYQIKKKVGYVRGPYKQVNP